MRVPLMWRPHTFENVGFQRSWVGQGKENNNNFNLNVCLAFRRLGYTGWFLIFLDRIVCFQFQLKMDILQGLKPYFILFYLVDIKVGMDVYKLKKKKKRKNKQP
jgi:hypothetical protein